MMGRAFLLGDAIDTGQLAPGHLLKLDAEELAKHCLETVRPEFATSVRPGDFIVAGRNFGQGSSREQAAISLKVLGISAVFATSFARIFYRNAINIGLPVLELAPDVVISDGDELELKLDSGYVRNISSDTDHEFQPLPQHLLEIIAAGGLVPLLERRFSQAG